MSNHRIIDELEVPVPPYQLWRATLASSPEEKLNPMAAALEKAGVANKKEKEKTPAEWAADAREKVGEVVLRMMQREDLTEDQMNRAIASMNIALQTTLEAFDKMPQPAVQPKPETEKTTILPRMKGEKPNEELQVVQKEDKTKTIKYTTEPEPKPEATKEHVNNGLDVNERGPAYYKKLQEKASNQKEKDRLQGIIDSYNRPERRQEDDRRQVERRNVDEQRQDDRRATDRRQLISEAEALSETTFKIGEPEKVSKEEARDIVQGSKAMTPSSPKWASEDLVQRAQQFADTHEDVERLIKEQEAELQREVAQPTPEVGSETIYKPVKKQEKEEPMPLDADDAARQQLGAYRAPRNTSKEFKTPVAPAQAPPELEKVIEPIKEEAPSIEEQKKKLASEWKGIETRTHTHALKEDALRTAEKEEKERPLRELREKTETAEQTFKDAVEQRLYQTDKATFDKALDLATKLRNEYSAALEASDLPVHTAQAPENQVEDQTVNMPPTPEIQRAREAANLRRELSNAREKGKEFVGALGGAAEALVRPIAGVLRGMWENSKLKFTMDSAYSQVLAQMYNQIAATKHGDLRRATAEYEARQEKSEELEAKVKANPMDTVLLREAQKAAIRARESEQRLKRIDVTLERWEKLRKNECDQIAIRVEMRLRPYEETTKDSRERYQEAEHMLNHWKKKLDEQEALLSEAVAEGQRTARWFGLMISPEARAKIDSIKKSHMAIRFQITDRMKFMTETQARIVRAEKRAEPWRVIKEEVTQLGRPLGRKAVKPLKSTV